MGQADSLYLHATWDPNLTEEQRHQRAPLQSSFGLGRPDVAADAITRARRARDIASDVLDLVKEQAVFAHLVDGHSTREIADRIGLTKSEVGRIARRFERKDGKPEPVGHAQNPASVDQVRAEVRNAWGDAAPTAFEIDSIESRTLLQAAGLDTPASLALAERLAAEVLEVLHPDVPVTPGRLVVATVQVARDPEAAYMIAGYDASPEGDAALRLRISTARTRGAYLRADAEIH